jgi:hypothetical protein
MDISILIGKTLKSVAINDEKDRVTIITEDGEVYVMYHSQDCCESVGVDEVSGDLNDLIGTPILAASEDTNSDTSRKEDYDDSFTWTFYNLSTIKGHVQIKWYGSSNGYYSESVDFEKIS